MNKIENLFVSYEIAKQLKEKGFKIPVARYYRSDGLLVVNSEHSEVEREYHFTADDFNENWNKEGWVIGKDGGMCFGCKLDNVKYFTPYSAPTHQQVVDWLRENHSLSVSVLPYKNNEDKIELCWYHAVTIIGIYDIFCNAESLGASSENYGSYNEALNEGIKQALKLI